MAPSCSSCCSAPVASPGRRHSPIDQLLSFLLYLAMTTAVTGVLAMSLNVQYGYCGLVNFGQVVFLCVGGYAGGIAATRGVHPLVAVAIATLLGGVCGWLMSFTVRGMSGTYWGIVTLATAELARLVVNNESWIGGGANGLSVIVRLSYLAPLIFGSAVAVYLLSMLIVRSPFGRTLRLVREGDPLALSLGKDIRLFKMQAMTIGGMMGGLAGCLYAFLNGYISPADCLPIETFVLWAMVVVGGRGNVTGILIGTVVVQTLYVGSRFLTHLVAIPADTLASLRLVVIGAMITLMMMFWPDGVLPERRRIYRIPARD
jgi:ABC-type branched-subunit amino acid transport system permease subunit